MIYDTTCVRKTRQKPLTKNFGCYMYFTIMILKIDEFGSIFRYLPNKKPADIDGAFDFISKKIKFLHHPIFEVIKKIFVEGNEQPSWFFQVLVYLMSKPHP
ncbi:hypothetical protein NUSPORA_02618 [Nucleospora cyclopteri]